MMCGTSTTGETANDTTKSLTNESYRIKYQLISKRCKEIEQDNERLVNLIYQTYKLYVKGTKRKAILMKRLDSYNDPYRVKDSNGYIEMKREEACKVKVKLEGKDDVSSNKNINSVIKVTQLNLPANTSIITNCSKASTSKKAKNSSNISSSTTCVTNGQQSNHSSSSMCSTSSATESTAPVPPKKPINPYLLFCQMNRSTIQEQLNNDKSGKVDPSNKQELTRALANQWKILPPEQKSTYSKLYEIEKEKYDKALKIFNASHCQSVMTNTSTAPSNKLSKSLTPITLSHSASAHFTSPNVTVTKVTPSSSTLAASPSPSPSPCNTINKISSTCKIVSSPSPTVTSIVVTNSSTISSLKQQHLSNTLGKSSSLLSNVTQNIFHVVPPSTTITPVLASLAATATTDTNQPCFTKINNSTNSMIKNRATSNSIIVNGTCTNGLTYTISNNCGTNSASNILQPASIVQNGTSKNLDILATRK